MKYPKVSIITCTYNGGRIIENYFKHLFQQDYPKEKIEVIIADGGSTDKTFEVINKYQKKYPKIIRFFENKTKSKVGKNKGADIASRKASGEFLVLIDQDNILVQKDWITKMATILLENKDIFGVQSRLLAYEKSNKVDQYLNAIGIEDPFAIPYSLNSQITFNQKKFLYNTKGKFYTYEINKNNFYYAGDNGFITRKKDFFDNGGYTQDIDNFYRMAVSGKKYKVAVMKNVFLHHQSSVSMSHLLSKKIYYVRKYLSENYGSRDFFWFDLEKNNFKQNFKFILNVFLNLLFITRLFTGIKMMIKERKSFWIVHPFACFLITLYYIKGFFLNKMSKEQKEVQI